MATEATKLTAEEQKAVADAQQSTQALMNRVGQAQPHRAMADMVGQAEREGAAVVTVLIPKSFVLTLDGPTRDTVQFEKGVHRVPRVLLDNWYVQKHKVEEYGGTAVSGRTIAILSSNVFAADKGIDPAAVNDITVSAFTLSGLTPEAWNALTIDQRGDLMMDVHSHRLKMAARAAEAAKLIEGDSPK